MRPSLLGLLFGAAVTLLVAGDGLAQEYRLNIGHVLDPQHPVHIGTQRFSAAAAERSGGRIKITIFPSSQLGSGREMLQNTQSGVIHGVLPGTTEMINFVPEYGALDLPYLVKTQEDAYRLLDGPVVRKELDEKAVSAGFRVLHHWEVTFRDIYTTRKPIRALADLKGVKIRVIPSPSFVTLFRALGASPTPMAFGELYTALQQGVVDAAENDVLTYHSAKHFEVAKNLAITQHMMLVVSLVMSERHWKTYPPDIQRILTEASLEGRKALIDDQRSRRVKVLETLKASGVQITEPDLAPFVEAARKAYAELEQKVGKELVGKVTGALQ